jgi:hypothetical protein
LRGGAAALGALLTAFAFGHGPAASAGDARPVSGEDQGKLVESFNRWAAGLRTVRGGGRARMGAEGEPTRAFDFSVVLERPGRARMQGRWGSLATIFDLSGDAAGWTLYLPREASVVRAAEARGPGLLLPPAELLSVILPAGIPPRDLLEGGAASREDDTVRLVVPPGTGGAGSALHRVLWVDARDATPRRLELRRETQLEAPILVARYDGFEGKGAKAFPTRIEIEVPEEGEWARFSFNTVRLNQDLAPDLFDLTVPEGTREIAPDSLDPGFLPEEKE